MYLVSSLFFVFTLIFLANTQAETAKQDSKQALKQITQNKVSVEKFSVSTNKAGRMGASAANGKIIVPFIYDYVYKLNGGDYFIVGLPSKNSQSTPPLDMGIINAQGQLIIPIKYSGIDYDRNFKRFKVRLDIAENNSKFGFIDENGKIVVPVIYEDLERISNMGSEPTNVGKLNGKFGYINLITGKVMIPFEYDRLSVGEHNTDAQGIGIAAAQKNKKWGVLSTNGKILAPFVFDYIDDLHVSGDGLAELNGKVVQIKFKDGHYFGTSEVTAQYSANFRPRGAASINPKPFDGLYTAEDYPSMKSAWDALRNNKLRWAAIPSIQINGDKAYVAFGQFVGFDLVLPNELNVSKQKNGFTLMTDVDDEKQKKAVSTKFLAFTQKDDVMLCDQCAAFSLPARWLKTVKPQEYVGIGVAINKEYLAPVTVAEVLKGGPAEKAGLKAGDLITKVDDKAVYNFTLDDVTSWLKGKPDSLVTLTVLRNDKLLPKPLLVRRGLIKYQP